MIRFLKILFVFFLVTISLLGLSFYKTNIVYHKAEKTEFTEILDDTQGNNIYFFYAIGQSNTDSIQMRINKFYEECVRLGVDFRIIDMSLEQNAQYISTYPTTPGVNPYPNVTDINAVEDIFISQVPALLYTVDGEVVDFAEGSANVVYMMNDILAAIGSSLILDTN